MTKQTFWQEKTLEQMSVAEWESLCDGCGKCCVHKLEDEDTGEFHYTNVACAFLNTKSCRCQDYKRRKKLVPECISLTADKVEEFKWLPSTCAYRLVSEGKALPKWHPLIVGKASEMHAAGHSVRNKVISELYVDADNLEDNIVKWIN